MINVGCCEALDLRKASKGEVVTVGVALHGIGYSFFFSGIVKCWYQVRASARRRIGTLRGIELVKVSFRIPLSCFKCPPPKGLPLSSPHSLSGRERGHISVRCPIY